MWRGLLTNDPSQADIAVFAIPLDENCSVGRGAAEAARVLRECSEFLPPLTMKGVPLPPVLTDLGDVAEYDFHSVEGKMRLCSEKKLTLILGGDHSVSILSQKAYRRLKAGKRGIIHIDAHADICDFYDGSHYSHACVNRRALENGYAPEDISMVGIRSYEMQEVEFLSGTPVEIIPPDEVHADIDGVLSRLIQKFAGYDGVYLSFDIDAIDPAYAPGTGTPEAFGLASAEGLRLLTGLVAALPVDVMDIVEVSPPLDCNNITSWLALKYILEIIDTVNKK